MSKETQDFIHLLKNSEDYSNWAIHTLGLLNQKNCAWAINETPRPTFESVKQRMTVDGVPLSSLTDDLIVKNMQDAIKVQHKEKSQAKGIIQNQVHASHNNLIANKEAHEMWSILKNRFQDLSPAGAIRILHQMGKKSMTDYSSAREYCGAFETALDKISGMLSSDSTINAKAAETVLNGYMLMNVSPEYHPLVTQLQDSWVAKEVELAKSSKAIVNYALMKDKPKAMVASIPKRKQSNKESTPYKGEICTNPECIKKGLTHHATDKCWILHPELRPAKRIKTTTTNVESQKTETPKEIPHIDS